MKEILGVIHKTIYQFLDICGDDEEVPMSDKDKLLLEVNKAICNNLKTLEQEPCDYAISRQAVLDEAFEVDTKEYGRIEVVGVDAIDALPPVNSQQKTGHWIIIDDCERFIAKCSECGRIEDSRIINKYPYCHCGAKMVEPQESESDGV